MLRVIHEHCVGLDIHKKTVVACVLVTKQDGQVHKEVRTFGTTTGEILAMASLAQKPRSQVCGDGVNRSVLDSGLQTSGRGV